MKSNTTKFLKLVFSWPCRSESSRSFIINTATIDSISSGHVYIRYYILPLKPSKKAASYVCTAQWTIECIIGNLKQEIRQPSNYLANFANEGLQCAYVNALLAALPELDDSRPSLPTTALDLGDGYAFLRKRDKLPVLPSHGTGPAILDFLGQPRTGFPRIIRWARLSLPNGQIARSAWREKLKSPDKLRVSRMIKVCRIILSVIMYT